MREGLWQLREISGISPGHFPQQGFAGPVSLSTQHTQKAWLLASEGVDLCFSRNGDQAAWGRTVTFILPLLTQQTDYNPSCPSITLFQDNRQQHSVTAPSEVGCSVFSPSYPGKAQGPCPSAWVGKGILTFIAQKGQEVCVRGRAAVSFSACFSPSVL